MKRALLWKLTVRPPAGAEDLLAELLSARLAQPATIYTDVQTGVTTVAVFLGQKPDWSRSAQRALATELNEELARARLSLPFGIVLTRLRAQDWAESWKRHFNPMEIGRGLLIKPTWSKRKPKRGQALVELDPGMSFGTGHHPTTGFCLKELTRLRRREEKQSLLDVGTGSGILAIAAVKLGYAPVEAMDLDPDCIRVARANARLNQLGRRARFRCADICKLRMPASPIYSVVCANLMADLLLAQKARLRRSVQEGGHLVLAGILDKEFETVELAYCSLGFRLQRSRVEKEWRSGCFQRLF